MMWLHSLSDSLFVIVPAYISVLLPLISAQVFDVISPTWRRVREVRAYIRINLLLALPACLYLPIYCACQMHTDPKEMFSAVAALFFIVLHVLRTFIAYAHLRAFVSWATASIAALRALGVDYRLEQDHPTSPSSSDNRPPSPERIAEHLLVSDLVLDNLLFHRSARCYMRLSDISLRLDPSAGILLRSRLINLCRLLALPLRHLLRSPAPPPLRPVLLPHNPEDLFLRWTVTLAGQGLRSHLSARVLPARALLRAAYADDALSLSKQDLLRAVASSGQGLPLSAPHPYILRAPERGYAPYARKLDRIIDASPVAFHQTLAHLDTERLEWLAIYLCVGQAHVRAAARGAGADGVLEPLVANGERGAVVIARNISFESTVSNKCAIELLDRCYLLAQEEDRRLSRVEDLADSWLALLAEDRSSGRSPRPRQ